MCLKTVRRGGTLTIELSLLALMLTVLVVGVADASGLFRVKHVLDAAAREGARLAAVQPNFADNDPTIVGVMNKILDESGMRRIASDDGGTVTLDATMPDPAVTATASFRYKPILLSVLPAFPERMQATVTMRYEAAAGP